MKKTTIFFKLIKTAICCVLTLAMLLNMAACSSLVLKVNATDLTKGINANSVSGKAVDERFISSTADFSIRLFKQCVSKNDSSLISPLSVLLALSMTANGADGETLSQMEKVLGSGISIDEMNEYLYSYVNSLPSTKKAKLDINNSIWFRDDENVMTVKKDFLQKNADYYKASAYKSPFDEQTVKDINNWVKFKTDGMIKKMTDSIDPSCMMILINTVVFGADWEIPFEHNDTYNDNFKAIDGTNQDAELMNIHMESNYLDDGKATGFIKPYKNNKYRFAALLPNEGISINDYIASLTGEGFINTLKNANKELYVTVTMPKFSYERSLTMNEALEAMGMTDAFSGADFSRMSGSGLFISQVFHKTDIAVDELGTKAAAATKVDMSLGGPPHDKSVTLNRPFVYAIIDNATDLPIFIGTVMKIEK